MASYTFRRLPRSYGWDWPEQQLPHPNSPAGRNFVWADVDLPHPNSPAGRIASWPDGGSPHPNSPSGREYAGNSDRLSIKFNGSGQSQLYVDVGLGRPINVLAVYREGHVALPAWLPSSIQNEIPSLQSGVYRFNGTPPFGDIVVWTRTGLFGREIEAYQEFPEDEAFFLRFASGDAHLARRLREILAEHNDYMRYFVEEQGLSPYQARDEIRRIYSDGLIMAILDAFIAIMTAAASSVAGNVAQQTQRIIDAVRRTRWQPGLRTPKPRSSSAADSGASDTTTKAPKAGSSSATKPPSAGNTTGTKPPAQGESSSTFSEFPRQVVKPQSSNLNNAQLKNLKRFEDKLPKGALKPTQVNDLPDGAKEFSAEVPGRVPGSRAIYKKTVDASGTTTNYTKTTIDPAGKIVHVKIKF